jgi:hypothetical protein
VPRGLQIRDQRGEIDRFGLQDLAAAEGHHL